MKRFFTACLILLTLALVAHSQVLKVKVTLDPSNLPADEVNNLSDFPDKVEQYFNAYEWVEDEYEYDVICKVRIIIQSVQQKSHEKLYLAQFVITSESGEYFYDKIWEFPYDQGTPFSHFKGQFDPLTHFLDFYAYMVLAGELDTNDYLKGNSLYEKARDIANRGQLSKYPRGWSSRMNMVLVITDARTRPLREVKPDFLKRFTCWMKANGAKLTTMLKSAGRIKKVYKVQPNNLYLQYFLIPITKIWPSCSKDTMPILSCWLSWTAATARPTGM